MPINNYNTGRDLSVNFTLPGGNLGSVIFSNVTSWEARQRTKMVESHGIDGLNRFQEIPTGWEGSLEIDRATQNMDVALSTIENLYFAGQPVPASSITETIQEPLGGTTQWLYTGVMFKFAEHGKWQGDNKVTQRMDWVASERKQTR